MEDEDIVPNTRSWSSQFGQKVAPVHNIPYSCTGMTFCPYQLDQLYVCIVQHMKQKRKNRKDKNQALLCVVFKYIQIVHFYAFLNHFYCALLSLYRSWVNHSEFGFCQFARRSLLFALILIERHYSQNKGSLKSKEQLSDFKERCAQFCKICI